MPKKANRRIIRASEIGAYVYCRRAWWLRQVGGFEPQNRNFEDGIQAHAQHGKLVSRARWQRRLAFWLLLLAIGLLVAGGLSFFS